MKTHSKSFQPTVEQTAILDYWEGSLAIEAGAGCGKTSTLVEKCLRYLSRDPDARFLAISFTDRSAADLKTKFLEKIRYENPKLFEKRGAEFSAQISTIHGFFSRLIREFCDQCTTPFEISGQERMLNEQEASRLWNESFIQFLGSDLAVSWQDRITPYLNSFGLSGLKEIIGRLRTIRSFGISLDSVDSLLRELVECTSEKYSQKKLRLSAFDFSDLELWAERLTREHQIVQKVRDRYGLILIDEFQDTNPLQALILERIISRKKSGVRGLAIPTGCTNLKDVVIVGDPKQSIYRFRDADLTVFESWVQRMDRKLELSDNFRSCASILEVVNLVCTPLFEEKGLDYFPLRAGKRELNERGSFETSEDTAVFFDESQSLEEWAKKIKSFQNQKKIPDAVLLLRRIRGNEKRFEALRRADVEFILGGGGGFWEDPRVSEILSLLEWWAEPSCRLAGATFLRSPFVKMDEKILDAWLARVIQEDTTLFSLYKKEGESIAPLVYQALSECFDREIRPGELLAALFDTLQDSDQSSDQDFDQISGHQNFDHQNIGQCHGHDSRPGPNDLSEFALPLLRLWNQVEDLSRRGMRFDQVVKSLQKLFQEKPREQELPPPTLENKHVLRVMSIHASKGLEFETVILADLLNPKREPRASKVFYDRRKGVFIDGIVSDVRNDDHSAENKSSDSSTELILAGKEKAELKEFWEQYELKKEDQENLRLFYVAMTRAKKKLIFCTEKVNLEVSVDKRRYEGSWQEWITRAKGEAPQLFYSSEKLTTQELLCEKELDERAMTNRVKHSTANSSSERENSKDAPTDLNAYRRPTDFAQTWTKRRWSVTELVENLKTRKNKYQKPDFRDADIEENEASEWGKKAHQALLFQDLKSLIQIEESTRGKIDAKTVHQTLMKHGLWDNPHSQKEFAFEVTVPQPKNFPAPILVGAIDYFDWVSELDSSQKNSQHLSPLVAPLVSPRVVDYKFLQNEATTQELLERYQQQLEWYAWALARLDSQYHSKKIHLMILAFSGKQSIAVQWDCMTNEKFRAEKEEQASVVFRGAYEEAKLRRDSPVRRYMVHSSIGRAPIPK